MNERNNKLRLIFDKVDGISSAVRNLQRIGIELEKTEVLEEEE